MSIEKKNEILQQLKNERQDLELFIAPKARMNNCSERDIVFDDLLEAKKRIAELEMENAHLRIVAQKIGCPYGHRDEKGACRLGYPGCACMDDLLATLAWCPEDEEKVAVRLGKRIAELEAVVSDMLTVMENDIGPDGVSYVVFQETVRRARESLK